MLYNEENNTIIWLPYKNYSSSFLAYFKDGWRVFNSKHYVNIFDWPVPNHHHGISYPPHCLAAKHIPLLTDYKSGFRKILVLRNPYDRVFSMWKMHKKEGFSTTLDEWFENVFMFHPITFPVSRVFEGHYNDKIKVENLEHELKRLGLYQGEFPHLNISKNSEETLTSFHKKIIRNFHKKDFIEGGYDF